MGMFKGLFNRTTVDKLNGKTPDFLNGFEEIHYAEKTYKITKNLLSNALHVKIGDSECLLFFADYGSSTKKSLAVFKDEAGKLQVIPYGFGSDERVTLKSPFVEAARKAFTAAEDKFPEWKQHPEGLKM